MDDPPIAVAPRRAPARYRVAALSQEQTARQRLAELRREVSAERVAHARWSLQEQKQTAAERLRVEKDRMFNRDLRYHLADEPRATEAEVVRLAECLNTMICAELVPVDPAGGKSCHRPHMPHAGVAARLLTYVPATCQRTCAE